MLFMQNHVVKYISGQGVVTKSLLVHIYLNLIMFAHDLCHSEIEYFYEFFKSLKNLSKK